MSSPKRLFEKTASKRVRRDSDDKQELSSRQNVGRNVSTPSAKKPAFNPALLSSAFYSGPTMYGGAGASNSSPYNQYAKSKFYDRKKTDIKVTPSTPDNSMSQTSRRILDLLEQYSSPISDAKRVPINKPPLSHKKSFAHQSFLDSTVRSPPQENSTPSGTKINRFRELQIPSMATLMKMKRNNCTMSSPQTSITASMSSSLPYKPDNYSIKTTADAGNHKNKIRTKINRRADRFCDEELPEPVNLPNISLNMTGVKLPTFTMQPFNTPFTNIKPYTTGKRSEPMSTDSFKFSSPLNHGNAEPVQPTKKFFFRDPLDILSSKYGTSTGYNARETSPVKTHEGLFNSPIAGFSINKNKSNACATDEDKNKDIMSSKDELSLKHLGRRPAESWNGNDKSTSRDIDKSSTLVNGDMKKDEGKCYDSSIKGKSQFNNNDDNLPSINPKVSKIESPHTELANLIKKQKSQWECSACMTRNDDDKVKCVCCEGTKPGGEVKKAEPAKNTLPQSSSSLADFMKKQSAQWECSSCMSRNDNDKLKCVCCEAPKPGVTPKQANNTLPSVYPGMANFMKKQNSQWECSSCMTRNDDNRTKCVCCEALKPGCEPEKSSANFNFGSPQMANAFKFGIDQADAVTKPPDKDTKPVSEIEKKSSAPVVSAGFVFGNAAAIEVKPDAPKVGGFTFGIANGTPAISKESIPVVPVSIFGEKKDTPTPTAAPPPYSFGLKKPEVESNNTIVSSSTSETKTNTITFSSTKPSVGLITPSETKKEPEKISFGSQLSGSQLLTSSKLPSPPVSSTANVPPMKSPALAFTFGSPQATKPSGGFGGNSPFQFGAASATTAAAPIFKPAAAANFSFGSKDSKCIQLTSTKTTDSASSGADALFRIPPANPGSLFSVPASISSTNQDVLKDKIATGNISSGISFPSTVTVASDKPKDNPTASPFFSFGSSAPDVSSASASSGLFKPATSAAPVFSFGSNATAKTDAGSVPIFGSPSTAPAVSLFGAKAQTENKIATSPSTTLFKPAPSSIASPFAASSSNLFGSPPASSQPSSSTVFGANPLGQAANKPPSGIFGAPSATSPPASLFPGSGVPSSGFGGGNIFGSASRTNQITQPTPGPFGAQATSKPIPESGSGFMNSARSTPSSGLFSASPSPAVPSPAVGGLFGSSSAAPTPVFGSPIPFGETAQSQQPAQNVAFKFGAPSSTMSPAMGFGQPPAPTPSPMFSFGSQSAQPPPSGSQFNFSMGASASGFAPGVNPNGPQRKIKKAVRRTMR